MKDSETYNLCSSLSSFQLAVCSEMKKTHRLILDKIKTKNKPHNKRRNVEY